MIAALFVETDGVYFDLPGVDAWDVTRDARNYQGPWPIVAHPPCQRWGRFWHGSTRKPHQFRMGDDQGCFASALASLETYGGILEHPADSHAWDERFGFSLPKPNKAGGWIEGRDGLWCCHVEQGFYGHLSRKPTWLLAKGTDRPALKWGHGEQRLHPVALKKHGYEKARRIGMVAMVGGKDKQKIRDRTPDQFRDLLIGIAESAFSEVRAA